MIKIGFFGLSLLMLLSPFLVFSSFKHQTSLRKTYMVGAVLWLAYVIFISSMGWLADFSFPPRIPIFLVIPITLIMIYWTGRSTFKSMLSQISLHRIIYVQSFRVIVELLIYGAALESIIPMRATFEGLNYDIFVGASALVIGALVQFKLLPSRWVLIWNIAALAVLSVTVYAFISSYYFLGFAETDLAYELTKLPYVLLPGVLLPFAIFYHICSIRQCLAKG